MEYVCFGDYSEAVEIILVRWDFVFWAEDNKYQNENSKMLEIFNEYRLYQMSYQGVPIEGSVSTLGMPAAVKNQRRRRRRRKSPRRFCSTETIKARELVNYWATAAQAFD